MTAPTRAERLGQLGAARDLLVDLLDAADQSPAPLPTTAARLVLEAVQEFLDDGWADQGDLRGLIEHWQPVLGEARPGEPAVRRIGPLEARIADLQVQVVAVLGELHR